jgi:hypothetical protein
MTDIHPKLQRFRNFLRLVWDHLGLPEPTPIQLEIADYLQYGPKRKVVMAFRGVGKSWITSAYVCWRLLLNPQLKFLVVSASKERSDQFSTFTLRLIAEMPQLRHLYPSPDQRCSKVAFDVAPARPDHSPSVKSVGIFGQLTGSRADEIVSDDVEVPNTSETQVMRTKLSERVREYDAILKPGDHTRVTYLGTPQTEESLYNGLPERGYSIRIWPCRVPSADQAIYYGDRLAPSIAERVEIDPGKPTDPARFGEMDLMERELSYGRSGFALQFMLDTRLSDANRYPLKLSDLVIADTHVDFAPEQVIWAGSQEHVINDLPNVGFTGDRFHKPMAFARDEQGNIRLRKYDGKIMTIDPAGRGKDEIGYAVVGVLNSQLFVSACGGLRGGYEEKNLTALAMIAKLHKVNKIIVEPNFGDGMFNQLLKPVIARIYPCTVEDAERSNTQKERRIIDTLEPVMNQHRLVIDPKVVKQDHDSVKDLPPEEALRYSLFYQMTRITKDKGALAHDDRLDALALAVAYWNEVMDLDQKQRIDQHRREALDRELERFMEHAIGRRPTGDTWFAI